MKRHVLAALFTAATATALLLSSCTPSMGAQMPVETRPPSGAQSSADRVQSAGAQAGEPAPVAMSEPLHKAKTWPVSEAAQTGPDPAGMANLEHRTQAVGAVATDWWAPTGVPEWSYPLADTVEQLAQTPGVSRIQGTLVAATGALAAQRLVAWSEDGTRAVESRTMYVDLDQHLATSSHQLVIPDAVPSISGVVADSLAWAAGDLSYTTHDDPGRMGTDRTGDITFGMDGSMDVIHPDASGKLAAAHVPTGEIDPLLTDAGRTVRAAVMASQPFRGFPSQPAGAPPVQAGLIGATPTEDVDCTVQKCVALTFDDGPSPKTTPQMLDTLRTQGVHGTFFVLGDNVVRHPEIAARMAQEGHVVASHTWSHANLPLVDAATLTFQLQNARNAIRGVTQGDPVLMRPPYGEYNDAVKAESARQGQALIRWNVDTEDWKNKDAAKTTERALATASPGSIILMHDIHQSTVDAIPGIVKGLRERGFQIVTIPTLLGGRATPGTVYFSAGSVD